MTLVDRNIKQEKAAMTPEQRRQRQRLLSQLVYEMDGEKPVYYAGYREVLNGIFTNKYMPIAPDYVIEIDTKADLSTYQYQHDYFV